MDNAGSFDAISLVVSSGMTVRLIADTDFFLGASGEGFESGT